MPKHKKWKEWGFPLPIVIWWLIIAWIFFKNLFHIYLCHRQNKVFDQKRNVPPELRRKISPEIFEQSRLYRKEIINLEIYSRIYWIIIKIGQKIVSLNTRFWFMSEPILDFLNFWPDFFEFETGETAVFIVIVMLYGGLTNLPLKLYRHFVVEENFGFNKLTLRNFFIDFGKETLMEIVVYVSLGCTILFIVKSTGKLFFIWVWFVCFIYLMTSLAVYPNLIAPMFDTYTQLRPGRLRDRLKKIADFLGFPMDEILVVHQSWRSTHSDAYFISLLRSKRIVLYDTLLKGYPEADIDGDSDSDDEHDNDNSTAASQVASAVSIAVKSVLNGLLKTAMKKKIPERGEPTLRKETFKENEIQAIVARQIGHWKMGHSVLEIIFPQINLFLFFVVFSFVYQYSALYEAFGYPRELEKPIILGLKILFDDLLDIYRWCASWYSKYLSRKWEIEADQFAVRLGFGKDLKDAIIALNKENLKYPYADPLFVACTYDIPLALERLHEIDVELKKIN